MRTAANHGLDNMSSKKKEINEWSEGTLLYRCVFCTIIARSVAVYHWVLATASYRRVTNEVKTEAWPNPPFATFRINLSSNHALNPWLSSLHNPGLLSLRRIARFPAEERRLRVRTL